MPKALTPMHLKLQQVVSAVTGETGLAIIRAMRAGARDPVQLARLRHDRCHHDEATMAQARRGPWRDEPRLAVAQAVALDDRDHQKIGAGDRPIDVHRGTVAAHQDREAVRPVVWPRKRMRHRPHVDVRGSRHRITGVDLTALAGMDEPTALTLISELGLDLGRWPTVKHFPSWRGRCPPHRGSGGQV
jgi:hypothetical protein